MTIITAYFVCIHRVLELFIYMSMGTHLTACIWFMLACSSLSLEPYDPHVCDVESWAFHYSQSTALCM